MTEQAPTARTAKSAETAPPVAQPSLFRAWCFLVWLSIARQARMRQMVWIALGLLGFATTFIGITTASVGWNRERFGYSFTSRYRKTQLKEAAARTSELELALFMTPRSPLTPQWELGVLACADGDAHESL